MTKLKTYAYITRAISNGIELLVFTQKDHPDAGVQVPGGTVDPGESLRSAILREVEEESGLCELEIVNELGRAHYYHPQKQESQERHYFHLTSPESLPDRWSHQVTAGVNDKDLIFEYYWIPLSPEIELAGNQHEMISLLLERGVR